MISIKFLTALIVCSIFGSVSLQASSDLSSVAPRTRASSSDGPVLVENALFSSDVIQDIQIAYGGGNKWNYLEALKNKSLETFENAKEDKRAMRAALAVFKILQSNVIFPEAKASLAERVRFRDQFDAYYKAYEQSSFKKLKKALQEFVE